ncbi:MAG: DUF1080 domain-containing protein [Kiritimatiellae bacterium]|nr:DUF1080 domain-containing protein [Kiritimatiellia bacterium]
MNRQVAAWAVFLTCTAAVADDWRPLFNGQNLEGWMSSEGGAPSTNWVVENGELRRVGRAGYIWTRDRFGDFELELEYRTEGNSGVFFRTDNPRDPVQTGIEVQIHTPGGPNRHSVGAIYDLQAPTRNAAKDGWNRLRIVARGSRLQVELNGEPIIDMDVDRWTEAGRNPDGSKNKYKRALKDFARSGHIGFQDHGATVAFRNIRIRPLN